jgi:hypothetical protein
MSVAEKIEDQITIAEPRALAVMTPMDMINRAVTSGASMEVLEKMFALQERWEASQARKAFDNAMASAKAKIPNITKNRAVDFTSAKGRTNYKYEDLGEVARTVNPILAEHGLSYRFRTTSPINEPVTVTCIVSHRDGHFEENTLCAGRDDSGNKNSIQAIGSTLTYLQRMTLKAALGLAASNDDDAKAAGATEDDGPISAEQLKTLQDLIAEVKGDEAKACKHLKIETLADLPVSRYARAVAALEAKRSPL